MHIYTINQKDLDEDVLATEHLEGARETEGYRIDYDYNTDGDNIVGIGVLESKNGNAYRQTTESLEWETATIP